MNKYFTITILILFCGFLFMQANATMAYDFGSIGSNNISVNPDVPFQAGEEGVNKIFETVFNTAIIISAVIFVVMFLIGGILYLTAHGDEDQASKARKVLLQTVIGLVITLSSWAVGTWVLGILQK